MANHLLKQGLDKTLDEYPHAMEEGMANYPSMLAWEIPWTEEPGGLQCMGSQRV